MEKTSASWGRALIPKLRAGRRPISVHKLLSKERNGTYFKKHSAACDGPDPLWLQEPDMRIEVESKLPTKHRLSKAPSVGRPSDVPSSNISGIGAREEDGRSNSVTTLAGPNAEGGISPSESFPSSYKLGSVSPEEAQRSLDQLDALEKSKPTPGKVGRYAAIGAVSGPAISLLKAKIQGKSYFKDAPRLTQKLRHIAGESAASSIGLGLIPIARHQMDQNAEKTKLRKFVAENPVTPRVEPPAKLAGIGSFLAHHAPTAHAEHLTDLAGLGMMAAGSASHLHSQRSGQGEEGGPIRPTAQAGLDLGGLAMMAVPTVAALSSLRKGHAPGNLAGEGSRFTNIANLAGLGALAAPTADKIQARIRSAPGQDPEHKMLLGDKAHKVLELGGYGALAAPIMRRAYHGQAGLGDLSQLAGYATLAAPQVAPIEGEARTKSELAGLGLLAAPTAVHMLGRH